MGLRKLFQRKSLRKVVVKPKKDSLEFAHDDDNNNNTGSHCSSSSSNSSLSCSLASTEPPVLTTVATVVTDGIAVSTFVSSQGELDGTEEEERLHTFEYAPEIQDDAAIALLADDFTDVVAIATTATDDDEMDATDKAIDGAVVVDVALEESKEEAVAELLPDQDNLWLCVNNKEKIHVSQPQDNMFVCLTWNLCGAEQLSFLSKDDSLVMKKPVESPATVVEETKDEEQKQEEESSKSSPEAEDAKNDDDSSGGMEVALFTEESQAEEAPAVVMEHEPSAERRYSIDSFSGDILAEEKLLPRAMEVLAKQQKLDTLNEIEVSSP